MGSLWNRSGTIERYDDDLRADGALAYFFQGGTTTPMTVYADSGESDAHPHPVVADAKGRWPDIFVPYTLGYDVQVKSQYGEQLSFTRMIPNPNPIDQTVIVPPERQVQTGMMHGEFVNAPKAGYVRLNGKTIGDGTTSGPNSERANDDTFDLYRYCWNNISNDLAPVLPGGRGASADSDFAAHKTLTPPDMRGALFAGLDDMGNSPSGAYGSLTFIKGSSTIAGALLGTNTLTLTVENMPAHTHTGTVSRHLGHVHTVNGNTSTERVTTSPFTATATHTHPWGNSVGATPPTFNTAFTNVDHIHSYTDDTTGSGGFAPGGSAGATQGGGSTKDTAFASASAGSLAQDHRHQFTVGGSTGAQSDNHLHVISLSTAALPPTGDGQGAHEHTFTTDAAGGEILVPPSGPRVTRAFNNMPLTRLVTWFIKL